MDVCNVYEPDNVADFNLQTLQKNKTQLQNYT